MNNVNNHFVSPLQSESTPQLSPQPAIPDSEEIGKLQGEDSDRAQFIAYLDMPTYTPIVGPSMHDSCSEPLPGRHR